MAVRNKIPWPPSAEDLIENNVNIPYLVYNLLAWVLSGDDNEGTVSSERSRLSERNHRHVMSVAQDLLHYVSGGRGKILKHVVLPLTVRHLTTSSQLVEILNHLSHSLSSSLIQEVAISMAEIHLKLVEEDLIYTPPNI